MNQPEYSLILSTWVHIFIRRGQFGVDASEMINKALNNLQIDSIPFKDDAEMERLNTLIFSCECILKGPFPLNEGQQKIYRDRLNHIASLHPKSLAINDYPKAIEFWNMIDKMRGDFLSRSPKNNVLCYIDGPEWIVCSVIHWLSFSISMSSNRGKQGPLESTVKQHSDRHPSTSL